METKNGTIEKISIDEGIDKNGKPYKRWVFTVDGKKYSTFDKKIGENGFKAGDNIEMIGYQDGQYWNMTTMKKSLDLPPVTNQADKLPNGSNTQRQIVRQNALRHALKICELNGVKPETQQITEIAEYFVKYVEGKNGN